MSALAKDNGGMTLVEILLAIAVGAIILVNVSYLLVTSLNISAKNSANIEVQKELQTTLNLIVDNMMEAKGIAMVVPAAGDNTDCILLGDIRIKKNGTDYVCSYKGNAVAADLTAAGGNSLYLIEFPNEAYLADGEGYCKLFTASSKEESVAGALKEVKKYLEDLPAGDRLKWLLARDITSCEIVPRSEYGETAPASGEYIFEEPFTFHVSLSVGKVYSFGIVRLDIEDVAAVRNRLSHVYLTEPGETENDIKIYKRAQ